MFIPLLQVLHIAHDKDGGKIAGIDDDDFGFVFEEKGFIVFQFFPVGLSTAKMIKYEAPYRKGVK